MPWRSWALAALLAITVFVGRGLLIVQAHGPTYDTAYFLRIGSAFWNRNLGTHHVDNPAPGSGWLALPVWALGKLGWTLDDQAAQVVAVLWKTPLAVALVLTGFGWAGRLYGKAAAWLVLGVLLIEPNLAAHAPLCTGDTLVTPLMVLGLLTGWAYANRPTWGWWLAWLGLCVLAVNVKLIALPLPLVIVGLALLGWRRGTMPLGRLVLQLALAAPAGFLMLWAVQLFDISPAIFAGDAVPEHLRRHWAVLMLEHPLPAGNFLRSIIQAYSHAQRDGHWSFLLGARSRVGFWYYYPVVTLLKVPIPLLVLLGAGAASLVARKPRWNELPLLLAIGVFTLFFMMQKYNAGYRHFLPVLVLLIVLSGRVLQWPGGGGWWGRAVRMGAAALVVLAVEHVLTFHPDYLSYVNYPYRKPQALVTDSNLDWGQGVKQVGRWLQENTLDDGRPVHFAWFFIRRNPEPLWDQWIGQRAVRVWQDDPIPQTGLLILSATIESGVYDERGRYGFLRDAEPIAVIGHANWVYDLDALRAQGIVPPLP
jgi:hypothetical protein